MSDDKLIRVKNLNALKLSATDLSQAMGTSEQYWGQMLAGKKNFGEKVARKLEEKLQLPRGHLDRVGEIDNLSPDTGKQPVTNAGQSMHTGSESTIPTTMHYTAANLSNTILLMGSLLGTLDQRSRRLIGDLLKDLACNTDDAKDIAEKASALATTQAPISNDAELNRAMSPRKKKPVTH